MGDMRPVQVSNREADVLAALGEHRTNAQIASRLHLSVRTVEGYISSLLRKYGASDRRDLAALAETVADNPAVVLGGIAGFPSAQTSFVGRGSELAAVATALDSQRLVTLHGSGGVGKTRLAVVAGQAAADTFPFGGAFVDLVPARDVVTAIAGALDVSDGPDRSLLDAVVRRLGRGRSLLVLDNCEHLIDDAARVADEILAACPDTVVLATSRERLGLPQEHVVPVGPLPLGSDAERLFADRATAPADPAVVTRLCAQLDGVPLAIELAAARMLGLGEDGLLAGLADRLRLLSGGRGRNERHRSLRSVLAWSYDLMDDSEQALLRALALFAGTFDLQAVVQVTGLHPAVAADLCGRLADKSLLLRLSGEPRWRLLATVRAFADERLHTAVDAVDLRQRYLAWAADAARDLVRRLDDGHDWTAEFDAVADDLRAASTEWHSVARQLARLAHARGYLAEAAQGYRRAAAMARTPSDIALDLRYAAECAQSQHDSSRAFQLLLDSARHVAGADRANALARAVELALRCPSTFDEPVPDARLHEVYADAVAADPGDDDVVRARLAIAKAWYEGPATMHPDEQLAHAAVDAARRAGDPLLISAALDSVRHAVAPSGRVGEMVRAGAGRVEQAGRMSTSDPLHAPELEDLYCNSSYDQIAVGDIAAAIELARIVLDGDLHGDYPHLSASAALPALALGGELKQVALLGDAMWDSWIAAGSPPAVWLPVGLPYVGMARGLLGDHDAVATWAQRSERTAAPDDVIRHGSVRTFAAARVAVHTGAGDAAALVAEAFAHPLDSKFLPYAHAAAAELAVVAALPEAGDLIDEAAEASTHNAWAHACLLRARARLAGDRNLLADAATAFDRIGARFEHEATRGLMR
jgi:predicted ATPase/DNA-binding CsgD family transcriptional regulator